VGDAVTMRMTDGVVTVVARASPEGRSRGAPMGHPPGHNSNSTHLFLPHPRPIRAERLQLFVCFNTGLGPIITAGG